MREFNGKYMKNAHTSRAMYQFTIKQEKVRVIWGWEMFCGFCYQA